MTPVPHFPELRWFVSLVLKVKALIYLRNSGLMVDSYIGITRRVRGLGKDEAVVTVFASRSGTWQAGCTNLAGEVSRVAGKLEVDSTDAAVILSKEVVGNIDVLIVGWGRFAAVSWVGAVAGLGCWSCKSSSKERGNGKVLHVDG
jgi:hypothetical protein